MSVPSPEELYEMKQYIPTSRLLRWIEDSDFIIRSPKGGSTHRMCSHKEETDITFPIILDSDRLSSRRNFADALRKLEDRLAEKKQILSGQFEKAMFQKLEDIKRKLPSFLIAEFIQENDTIILRDRHIPQIGITLKAGEERLLENKIRYLEDIKRDAYKALNQARNMFDVSSEFKRGVFTGKLSHRKYDIRMDHIAPYETGANPHAIFEYIHEFNTLVEKQDADHKNRLDSLLKNSFVKATMVAFSSRRGERTNIVSYEKDGNPQHLSFTFETASNRRANSYDVHGGRISEQELARVENIINGIARTQNALPAQQRRFG